MVKWNKRHWTYVIVNWMLSFSIFAIIFYFTPFGSEFWTWAKYGLTIVLYIGAGLLSSIALSFLFHHWKHWNWANVLLYRPISAALSATILAIGFAWLLDPVLPLEKSLAWLIITKLFVIGTAKMISLIGKGKVEVKFAKDLLEVS